MSKISMSYHYSYVFTTPSRQLILHPSDFHVLQVSSQSCGLFLLCRLATLRVSIWLKSTPDADMIMFDSIQLWKALT